MPDHKRPDPKLAALRERGLLNPKPERVIDETFQHSQFFDARDLLQVKYEMIRSVQIGGASVARAASAFGFSRPSFYQAQSAFSHGGLPALLPKKRGPRHPRKLGRDVMDFIQEIRAGDRRATPSTLVGLVKERFGLVVHQRSVERALARLEKKRQ
jgi:transposase